MIMSLHQLAGDLAYPDTQGIAQMSLIQDDPFLSYAVSPSCAVIGLNIYGNSHCDSPRRPHKKDNMRTFSFLSHTLYRSAPSLSLLKFPFDSNFGPLTSTHKFSTSIPMSSPGPSLSN